MDKKMKVRIGIGAAIAVAAVLLMLSGKKKGQQGLWEWGRSRGNHCEGAETVRRGYQPDHRAYRNRGTL